MKKAIVISGSIVVILIVAGFVITGILNWHDADSADSHYENISFLRMTDIDEITSLSEESKLPLIKSDDNTQFSFESLDVGDFKCSFTYQFDGENIQSVMGGFESDTKIILNDTSDENYNNLISSIEEISLLCEYLFGEPVIDKYNIYANEGYPLERDDQESYMSILNDKANFKLFVRDVDDSYWEFFTYPEELMNEGSATSDVEICFGFTRMFNVDSELSADVVLK